MITKKQVTINNELPILLDSIYCLHRIGDHSGASDLAAQSKDKLAASPVYHSIAQLIHLIGNYQQNIFSSADFEKLISLHPHIVLSNCPLYVGWSHFLHGFHQKQKDAFEHAIRSFSEGAHFNELFETFYWMDKHRLLPMEEKIHSFLRLYPVNSVYSFLMGNTYFEKELSPLTMIEKQQMQFFDPSEENHFDCWLIQKQSIMPAHYNLVSLETENFLDLYSGLINDRGEYIYLLIGELNCLSYLIASQLTGASVPALAEFLGRTEEEAEALVRSLKTMGIPISNKKGSYFLEWQDKPVIIVPRNLKVVGLQEFVRKKKKPFTKSELIELLHLTHFGAEALLRKWALAGHIRPVEDENKAVIWKFV